MHYNVLGKLEVVVDDAPCELGAFRQRALLALLLTSPRQVFSTDQLIDGLWGEEGGPGKQNSLWAYISGIRNALEPGREKRSEGTVLLTRAPGYVLDIDPDAVDAVRFERLITEGRGLADADPAAASVVLGEALALWRGRAFEEFQYEPFAQSEIARLEGLRTEGIEARIDVDLERGLARELVSELEALVREHPLHERFTGQLMLALYRSGRQADALRVLGQLKSRLGEELGIEVSSEIRRLEDQIVLGDEAIAPRPGGALGRAVRPGLVVRGYELREQIGEGASGVVYRAYQPSVGREVAIKVIRPELANDPGFIRRFEAEAQLVAHLEHPHIVPLYDYWREPDAAYLVMRLMQRGNLGDLIDAGGLGIDATARVAEQLGRALGAAHRAGVVHRDLKPANILIDDDANAYLADFGIAMEADASGPDDPRAVSSLVAPFASPEQLAAQPVDAASDVYSLGVVMAQAFTGRVGSVEELRDDLPTELRPALDRATASDAGARHEHVQLFTDEIVRALGTSKVEHTEADTVIENPYKGLRAFGAADTGDFHGRTRLIERLVARLGEPGNRGRFVALVGPSGSGKSSVVKAGLLPALREGAVAGSHQWFTVEMTPAPHPFEELEDTLLSIAVDRPPSLLEVLAASEDGLRHAVRNVLPADGAQLLLVIDQFEELFTQVDPDTAQRFLDALVAAVRDPQSGVHVLVTLRADFYDAPLRHRGLGELLRDGTEVITPMTADELASAITDPVERLGVTVEPALVAELVRDVSDRAGALPLLQYTLTELFDARRGQRMTAAAYGEIGGVSGVLAKRADGLLDRLGVDAADVARQVFLRLVSLGEGAEDTRRRVLRTELEHLELDSRSAGRLGGPSVAHALSEVLETFGRHRLLSFDRDPVTRGPTVEISHEALLTEWGRLRRWIDEAREDVRNQRRLASAMGEWAAAGQGDEFLLHGGLLEQLARWAPAASLPLATSEQAFLDRSLAARERADEDEREREERTVQAELSARRRLRQLAVAGVMGVVVAALAVFGIVQWRSASDARDEAAAERDQASAARDEAADARDAAEAARASNDKVVVAELFRTASDAALTTDPELALLYAVEAVRATASLGYATEESIDSVHWAVQELGVQYPVGRAAPTTLRSGPTGLTGVFPLPPAELVDVAVGATERRLADSECEAAISRACPEPVIIDADVPLRFGVENYRVEVPDVVDGLPTFGAGPLAGTRVTIAVSASAGNNDGVRVELERFRELTGIEVDLISNFDFDLTRQLTTGDVGALPDVVGFFFPPPAWATDRVIDLSAFLDTEVVRADFGDRMVDLVTVTDESGATELQSIVMNAMVDGLVYYPKPAFEAAGYEIPATWDELIALSNQIVADGESPWCFQWEAGTASGFVGTDLLESMVMRVGGPEAYSAWIAGDLAFDSPTVVEAARLAEQLLFTDGFVRGGPGSISNEEWSSAMTRLLAVDPLTGTEGPQCWFVLHSAQAADLLGPDTPVGPGGVLGVDVDFFPLPPLDADEPPGVTATTIFATAMTDRPEVRALMAHIASPEWGEAWASAETIGEPFTSSNRRFTVTNYRGPRGEADFEVRAAIHELNVAALEAGTWRGDASDLMPPAFGTWTVDYLPGPFWQGMIDWVDQVQPIEEILADLEAARPD